MPLQGTIIDAAKSLLMKLVFGMMKLGFGMGFNLAIREGIGDTGEHVTCRDLSIVQEALVMLIHFSLD